MGPSSILVVVLLAVCSFVTADLPASSAGHVHLGQWELNDFLLKTPEDVNRRVYKEPPQFLSQLTPTPTKNATGDVGSHGFSFYHSLSSLHGANSTMKSTRANTRGKSASMGGRPAPSNTILKAKQTPYVSKQSPPSILTTNGNTYTPYAYAKATADLNSAHKDVSAKFPTMTLVTDSSDQATSASIAVASAVNLPADTSSVLTDIRKVNSNNGASKNLAKHNLTGSTNSNNIQQGASNGNTGQTHSAKVVKPTLGKHTNSTTKQLSGGVNAGRNDKSTTETPKTTASSLKSTKISQNKATNKNIVNVKPGNQQNLKTSSGVMPGSTQKSKSNSSPTSGVKMGTQSTQPLQQSKASQGNEVKRTVNKTRVSNVGEKHDQIPKSQPVQKTQTKLHQKIVNANPQSKTASLPTQQMKSQITVKPTATITKTNAIKSGQVVQHGIPTRPNSDMKMPNKPVIMSLKGPQKINDQKSIPTVAKAIKEKEAIKLSGRHNDLMAVKKAHQLKQVNYVSSKPIGGQKMSPTSNQLKFTPKKEITGKVVDGMQASSSNTVSVATKPEIVKSNIESSTNSMTSGLPDKLQERQGKQKKFQEKVSNWKQLVQNQEQERRDKLTELVTEFQQLQKMQYPVNTVNMYPNVYNPNKYLTNYRMKFTPYMYPRKM